MASYEQAEMVKNLTKWLKKLLIKNDKHEVIN